MSSELPTDVPSRAHQIIVTIIVCTTLSTIFVTVRLCTRYFVNRAVGWDDYAALATLPFVIAYGTLLGINTRYGMGLHQKDMSESLTVDFYKWIDIGAPTYHLSLMGYKLSILLLYLRIYRINRPFRYATYATMFIVFSYLFSNIWTQLFGCHPFEKEYNKKLPGHCIDYIQADYAYGALNCITDLIIFVLPLPMIWRLHLNVKEKIGISLIFMVGSLNWAVAIVRLVYAIQDLTDPDRTWKAAETFLWSIIEVNTGLICSCVPVLKPFFRRVVPQNLSDRSWGLRKGHKVSWTGDTLQDDDGDDGYGASGDKAYLELEHGKNPSVSAGSIGGSSSDNRVFLDGSVSTVAPRNDSEGAGGRRPPPAVAPPKDRDLEDAKYGFDVDRV